MMRVFLVEKASTFDWTCTRVRLMDAGWGAAANKNWRINYSAY